eukprot:SAG11_NODE_2092_length_3841_cov_2.213789_1_plen_86_part_10
MVGGQSRSGQSRYLLRYLGIVGAQVYLRGKWGPKLGAMGDRFSHNLLHDAPGQLITTGTLIMMFDHNEVFKCATNCTLPHLQCFQ